MAAGAVIAALQGGGQALFALVDPVLCTFVGAAAALVALYPLSRWRRYAEPPQGITERPAMREERPDDASDRPAPMGLAMSFFPYVVLSVAALGVLAIEPVNRALRAFSIGMPFPAVTTGFGVANPVEEPYSPFSPLTHPGSFLLVTALVTWAVFEARGYYREWSSGANKSIPRRLIEDAVSASVPVIAFLVMAQLMNHSGQNEVLGNAPSRSVSEGAKGAADRNVNCLRARTCSSTGAVAMELLPPGGCRRTRPNFVPDARDPLEPEAYGESAQGEHEPMTLPAAFAPYIFFGSVAVVVLTVAPIRSTLEALGVGLPFPATTAGFGVSQKAVDAYAAFAPLTHPGTFLLISALFGYMMFKRRGRYPEGAGVGGVLGRAAKDALPVTTSITAVLLMSGVMRHSGEVTVLANTASNVLFGPLQATGAAAESVSVPLALGAQAGGRGGGQCDLSGRCAAWRNDGRRSFAGWGRAAQGGFSGLSGLLISLATVALSVVPGGGG